LMNDSKLVVSNHLSAAAQAISDTCQGRPKTSIVSN
jgi:hypothetical protein